MEAIVQCFGASQITFANKNMTLVEVKIVKTNEETGGGRSSFYSILTHVFHSLDCMFLCERKLHQM